MRGNWGAAAIVLVWSACGGDLFTVGVEDEATTTIPAATPLEVLLGDVGFGDFASMDLTSSQEIRNQGVEPGDIEEVFLVAFELEALSPDGADLSFIDRMELYVEAPGLPRRRVASQDDFPAGEAVVAFELEGVDLTDYVVSEAMTLSTEVEGRRPDDDTEVEARYGIDVGVTAQGACNQVRD